MRADDNEIREFFHQNRPQTADGGKFMAELSSKMDAMDEIKRIHDAGIRHYRNMALIAFFAGILAGSGVIAIILLHPITPPRIDKAVIASAASFISEWKVAVPAAIALTATILALIPWGRVTR